MNKLVLFLLLLFIAGCNSSALIQVEPSKVCMVNDNFALEEQIPVKVNEKMYYGCCQGCVRKLNDDISYRTAIDPVSGKVVDKSQAIIGAESSGKVYYFENLNNLNNFQN